jgi:O-acetyl-ADP-ribose deacetylase (regulator of RNase III)
VIHTVGPVWGGGNSNEDELLARAYLSSLTAATETGCRSVAFPAISTGIYGFPKERAASIVFPTVTGYLDDHELPAVVYLVFFSGSDAKLFLDTVECR